MKSLFFFVILCLMLTIPISYCQAQTPSSLELINNAKQYDEKSVVYEGEVIGDVMARGDYAWVNVLDGENAIGVWINSSLAKNIKYTGSYKSVGDRIEITGIFNRACVAHGGDLDIHAQGMRVLKTGVQILHQPDTGKRNLVIILCGAIIVLWILTLFLRK